MPNDPGPILQQVDGISTVGGWVPLGVSRQRHPPARRFPLLGSLGGGEASYGIRGSLAPIFSVGTVRESSAGAGRCPGEPRLPYFRMLTARATTNIAINSEMVSSSIIMSLAQGLMADTSVGLNAVAVVNERCR